MPRKWGLGMEEIVVQLVKQIKKGEHEAFEKLVDMYKNKVYTICLRMVRIPQEAEDLAQETFIRAYNNIERYEVNRKFSTWLFRIATNLSIDYLRKKKPGASLDAEIPGTEGLTMYSQLESKDDGPQAQTVKNELSEWVRAQIQQLPEKYRTAITLKYIEDLSLKEISDILDIPTATVKTRIHRGREALRKRMGEIKEVN